MPLSSLQHIHDFLMLFPEFPVRETIYLTLILRPYSPSQRLKWKNKVYRCFSLSIQFLSLFSPFSYSCSETMDRRRRKQAKASTACCSEGEFIYLFFFYFHFLYRNLFWVVFLSFSIHVRENYFLDSYFSGKISDVFHSLPFIATYFYLGSCPFIFLLFSCWTIFSACFFLLVFPESQACCTIFISELQQLFLLSNVNDSVCVCVWQR